MKRPCCKGVLVVAELGRVGYADALAIQETMLAEVQEGGADDMLLLLEHPPVFTLGRNAAESNVLVSPARAAELGIGIVRTNRGGDVTYHGPGQLVGYPILRLKERGLTVVGYVDALEKMLMAALMDFGIATSSDSRRRGVWVGRDKIAAIGVRVSRGVSMHGFALNVGVDLTPYSYIVPCGLRDCGVTSLHLLKPDVDPARVREAVVSHFISEFGYERARKTELRI